VVDRRGLFADVGCNRSTRRYVMSALNKLMTQGLIPPQVHGVLDYPLAAILIAGKAEHPGLEGAVEVAGIGIDDENIRPHLLSPDFFDAERNPQIRFRSTSTDGSAEDLRVTGELEMAGVTGTVEARGAVRGPVAGPGGGEKLALALEATVDRTDYGMNWQMDLPSGGVALAHDVKLLVELELNRA
jgi:polyisoprenoid-binding protein YceI